MSKFGLAALSLLTASVVAESLGKIVVFDGSGSPAIEALSMAAHGPELNAEGLLGRLAYLSSDVTACSGLLSTVNAALETSKAASAGLPPIVLIERSMPDDRAACTFEDKVVAVQRAGAAAAVVFDYMNEGPVAMYYEHPEGVAIPAVFVSNEVGQFLLKTLVDLEAQGAGRPAVLLRPPGDAEASWLFSRLRFEYLSFSVGYLLLALCALPVAVVNARAMLKRRRALEAVNTAVHASGAKAQVEAELARAGAEGGLPTPLKQAGAAPPCRKLYKFLCLTVLCYIFQMALAACALSATDERTGEPAVEAVPADQDEADGLAMLFGLNSVFNAILNAALITALARALRACKRCLCGGGADGPHEADAILRRRANKLKQLEDAHDAGLLSDEEFASTKGTVLATAAAGPAETADAAAGKATVHEGVLYVELDTPAVLVKRTLAEP